MKLYKHQVPTVFRYGLNNYNIRSVERDFLFKTSKPSFPSININIKTKNGIWIYINSYYI